MRKPAILVHEHGGSASQPRAMKRVFTSVAARRPLPGAKYSVLAACRYVDVTFVFQKGPVEVPGRKATDRAKFNRLD